MRTRRPKMRPRSPHDGPGGSQKSPKAAQEGPKIAPSFGNNRHTIIGKRTFLAHFFLSLGCVQDGPRGPQDRPMTAQEAPQRAQRCPRGPQYCPKFRQTSSHSYWKTYMFNINCLLCFRCVQDGPRGPQDSPMTAQEAPQRASTRPSRAQYCHKFRQKSSHSYGETCTFSIICFFSVFEAPNSEW